jgi:cytochrome c-type biogenesis protein CcmH
MSRRLVWAVMGLVLVVALGLGSRGPSGPPTEDQRVHRMATVIRCPTCQGLSAAQSDAPSSEAIRDEIRRRVRDGETDDQIRDYLVSRYGSGILLEPPATGLGILVWALPLLGGVLAVGGLGHVLRRNRVRPGRRVSAADQALVDQALGPRGHGS